MVDMAMLHEKRKDDWVAASHDAAASAVGYIFQTQWGLLEVIRASTDRPDQLMSFERIDDIAWETEERDPEQLLQLKHHLTRGTVTDKNVDVWRTLRVWMDAVSVNTVEHAEFFLVTTDIAAEGSALALLRHTARDVEAAERLLLLAAKESRSAETERAREQFLQMSDNARRSMVARMHVLDGVSSAQDVSGDVRNALTLVLPSGHEEVFLRALWGWWYSVVLDMLQGRRDGIRPSQVKSKISDLRDEFSRGNLPTLVHNLDEVETQKIADSHGDRIFVHQMRWVNSPETILARAIVDYYRAVVQSRLWLEDDLVGLHELEKFEHNLIDEWQREMAWRLDDLPDQASEEEKVAVGRQLLRDALAQTRVRVRERYDEAFFSRGKYHELADSGRVGWHPDFETRLTDLLARATS